VEYRAHVHLRVELESLDSVNRSVSTIMEDEIGVPLVARGRPVVDDRARAPQVIVSARGDGSMIPAPKKAAVLWQQEPRRSPSHVVARERTDFECRTATTA
jgi:hypothetical protein